jgi:hypothetical protein
MWGFVLALLAVAGCGSPPPAIFEEAREHGDDRP